MYIDCIRYTDADPATVVKRRKNTRVYRRGGVTDKA